MNENSISVVFPAYNEEKNIKIVVLEALKYLETIKEKWEIIIIDDGSSDNTGKIIDKFAQNNRKIKIIHHLKNEGYGKSLKDGFAASSLDFVFFTDSDRQFSLKALDIMYPLAKTGVVDLVIGYRINRQDPFLRKFLSWGYNSLAGLLFNLQVKDIDCAFKILKKSIFNKIKIESSNFFINTEILAKAKLLNYKILEVGVPHFPRKAGKSTVSLKYFPLTVRELWRIYWSLKIKRGEK